MGLKAAGGVRVGAGWLEWPIAGEGEEQTKAPREGVVC